jgi:ribosomal protein L18
MQKVVVNITNNSCKCQIVANWLVTKTQFSSNEGDLEKEQKFKAKLHDKNSENSQILAKL